MKEKVYEQIMEGAMSVGGWLDRIKLEDFDESVT